MYKSFLKPWLFKKDPEDAHHATFGLVRRAVSLPGGRAIMRGMYHYSHPSLARTAFGLRFENPVGLAAGLDKDGLLVDVWPLLGFGFAEVGTVTPLPQPGNPRPRLFRLPADAALINRMGFNNAGAEALAKRLENRPEGFIIGANIGKNKDTPNEDAALDYVKCLRTLHAVADYFVVNVSSPNTPGLRALQDGDSLRRILSDLANLNHGLPTPPRPILLKLAPDLEPAQLDDAARIVAETGTAGIVATNTTISRAGLATPAAAVESIGNGGLSGKPLTHRSTDVVRHLAAHNLPIIGVGGIHSGADAQAKLAAGATLVQVYTGFIYEGPGLVKQILKHLVAQEGR